MEQDSVCIPARTIGIDLSDENSTFAVMDGDGRLVKEGTVATTREELERVFSGIAPARVVIEASTQSPWVARHLASLGHEVIVANPRKLDLITKNARKTDRNDARILARLGRVDPELLSPVFQRGEESLVVRALLRARKHLVWMRTRLISFVRAESKVHGMRLPSCASEVFGRRAGRHLPDCLRPILDPVLEELVGLTERIAHYDAEIERLGRERYPVTQVLRQVRGVGPVLALSYVVTIEDPCRFKDSRNVGAYLGLTPRVHQSAKSDPHLRISKQGDGSLRTLLVTAATHILRRSSPDSDLKRQGRRLANRGNPRDKARARVAVARKLSILLHRLWLTGEVYEPLRTKPTV